MIKIENILICGLVISLFIVGCEKKKEETGQVETKVEEGKKIIQQEKQEAAHTVESTAKQAEEKAAKGGPGKTEGKTESVKDKTALIVQELIAKAKALLDKGEYKEAGATAQEILKNYDSESQEAKDIIATVTEKLKTTPTEKSEEVKKDIKGKLEGLGK